MAVDPEQSQRQTGRPVPWQQVLLDDIFLLFLFGILIPTFFYIVWGLMSLGEVPLFSR
jgi:hypothetical protein